MKCFFFRKFRFVIKQLFGPRNVFDFFRIDSCPIILNFDEDMSFAVKCLEFDFSFGSFTVLRPFFLKFNAVVHRIADQML